MVKYHTKPNLAFGLKVFSKRLVLSTIKEVIYMDFVIVRVLSTDKNRKERVLSCQEIKQLIDHRLPHSQYDDKHRAVKIPLEYFGDFFRQFPSGYAILVEKCVPIIQ